MQAGKENLKPPSKHNCTIRKSAEEDIVILTSLASEILKLLSEFSNSQDFEIKQISEYSEESFAGAPKL